MMEQSSIVTPAVAWPKRCRTTGAIAVVCLFWLPASQQAGAAPTPWDASSHPLREPLKFSKHPTEQEIFRARLFEEPLVPIGGEPNATENAALAVALQGYAQRMGPDDFASLTNFLTEHPGSAYRAALLTCLGLEYYKTAHYSLALEAWEEAWSLGQTATTIAGRFLADRAVCELAGLYSRLGRMNELEALLKSVENRMFIGGATERINLAREALALMQYRPEVSFRCGPLALQSIKHALDPQAPGDLEIFNSTSTQRGFSLAQVAELSKKIGLNYQMAFREAAGAFMVPSVVHWRVGHYAALVRKVGDSYLLEDPTFRNTVWASQQALESETSGYFLVPPGELPRGWRTVDASEGATVWGKGATANNDPDQYTCRNEHTGSCGAQGCRGMADSTVHLMLVNLQVKDTPFGYVPPVGPPVTFTVRYNHRDYLQPSTMISNVFGPKWTHDWLGYISDNPTTPLADVKYIVEGGGARIFTGFDTNSQIFAPQQYDQTLLRRVGADPFTSTYEMIYPDGSKKVFGLRTPSSQIFLTQVVDPAGNAVTLTWEDTPSGDKQLTAITDAIGQVTTISYEDPDHSGLITKVTDPFGRFAKFEYTDQVAGYVFHGTCPTNLTAEPIYVTRLHKITDVLSLTSQVTYETKTLTYIGYDPGTDVHCTNYFHYTNDLIVSLSTPYGNTTFTVSNGPPDNVTMRFAEIRYPDGSRARVEFNQSPYIGIAASDPAARVPTGMAVYNSFLHARNTYYWDRNACATAYGDYTKARIYHWLHSSDDVTASGILESTKEPLEGRVWYDYAGQAGAYVVGNNNRPLHAGRVLDDGSTQLYTYGYNSFGHLTNRVDPIGRKFSYIYATNGIDLVEVRQTRAGNNELLFKATYNSQHRPLTVTDTAGQTTTFTYNPRGQVLTVSNPRSETITNTYDPNGYLITADGPLPGTSDLVTVTYDLFGRIRTLTDVSAYTLTFDYDAMDRLTRVTHPDGTFSQYNYNRLDLAAFQDRAGRLTLFEYNNMREVAKTTDPLGRVTLFDWCRCGALEGLTDPIGRKTSWQTDIQGRLIGKHFADGSQVNYFYENAINRLQRIVDEAHQTTTFTYYLDGTLKSIGYANTTVPTPGVNFTYDPDYERVSSMTDGNRTTFYAYLPITGAPVLGAGRLASVDGPLPNDTITYAYDELGRQVSTAINGAGTFLVYDAAGRVIGETNALGSFTFGYEGASGRIISETFPNNQNGGFAYGDNLHDRSLQQATYTIGAAPISQFIYGRDIPAGRITSWSQQAAVQSPSIFTFGYDPVNQLVSATVTNSGALVNTYAYSYDPAGNRLSEQVGTSNYTATYNALNQLSTSTAPGVSRTNEWDGANRLVAVNSGNQRTEFTYDGLGRMVGIRQLISGVETSHRRFVWSRRQIREERDASGSVVTKRFFPWGMKLENGPVSGSFFYTRDHLGSIRELTDGSGNVRARYAYDPFGRRIRLTGDVQADFGFAGMLWTTEANLALTRFRAYDPGLGRWLSRDPLRNAEAHEGPNLYAYLDNEPVNHVDINGLISAHADLAKLCVANRVACTEILKAMGEVGAAGGAIGAGATRAIQSAPQAANALQCAADEIEALPAALGRLRAVVERLPEARRQMEAYLETIESDFPVGGRLIEFGIEYSNKFGEQVYRIPYFGPPQLAVDIEMTLDEIAPPLATAWGSSTADLRRLFTWLLDF
jgi:RHS repeat-associated protein